MSLRIAKFTPMLKIGLTGGIGTGKTTVANIFMHLGIPVFNADEAAKELMNENEALKQQIQQTFGQEAYLNGKLNRPFLAQQVFNNEFKLQQLNALVHPIVIEKGLQWASQQKAPYIIKEAALMFEAGSAFNLNYVIGVTAPLNIRIQRVIKRDNTTAQEVQHRMQHQISETIKMKLCDFVLVNNNQQLLLPQVIQLHQQLLQLAIKQ